MIDRTLVKAGATFALAAIAVGIYGEPTAHADTLIFGTSWALADEVSYDINPTPNATINTPPPDPLPPPDAEGAATVRIAQFRSEWGTLEGVRLEVDASALYTALLIGPPIAPDGISGARFVADLSVSGQGYNDSGSDTVDLLEGSDFLSILFGFDGPVSSGPFIGPGFVDYDVSYELVIDFAADTNGDGFLSPEDEDLWETSLIGGTLGTVVVTYTFTPEGSPIGGPPGGEGECLSCGPLPGDGNLDGFVGSDDLSLVLNNWNQSIVGWNNGDFDADGFIGVDDLGIVLGNWNAGTPPSSLSDATVPEPSSLFLIASSLLLVRYRRHSRRGIT